MAAMLCAMRGTELLHVNVSQTTLEIPMLPADQSVSSMQTVQLQNSAEIFIVLIHAQDCVAPMLTARLPITSPCVSATRDTLETHLYHAESHHHLLNQLRLKILVILILVDPTVNLQELLETDVNATVFQRCLDLLPTVDQSVRLMLTAPPTRPASTESVKTPALASVESMLIAESETIFLFVFVTRVILVIPSQVVTSSQVRERVIFMKVILNTFSSQAPCYQLL